MSYCRFGNDGGHTLFNTIGNNPHSIKNLNMSRNKFTSKNMDKLGYCIQNGSLEVLDITECEVGFAGMAAIGHSLVKTKLKTLLASSNQCGDQAA